MISPSQNFRCQLVHIARDSAVLTDFDTKRLVLLRSSRCVTSEIILCKISFYYDPPSKNTLTTEHIAPL